LYGTEPPLQLELGVRPRPLPKLADAIVRWQYLENGLVTYYKGRSVGGCL
jgi:hypothetical protein